MALIDFLAIDLRRQRARLGRTALRTQSHGATEIGAGIAVFELAFTIEPFGD